jgi:hypothetical protein
MGYLAHPTGYLFHRPEDVWAELILYGKMRRSKE